MDGAKLKIVLYIKQMKPHEWLMILYETLKQLFGVENEKSVIA